MDADGYVELVGRDPYMKVDGPFAVHGCASAEVPAGLWEVSPAACMAWEGRGKAGGLLQLLRLHRPWPCMLAQFASKNVTTHQSKPTTKPYYVGQSTVPGAALPRFEWNPPAGPEKKTLLNGPW